MLRRSTSLAIPHRKNFVAIPSVSLVTGPNFIHPAPTPEDTLLRLGVGGRKKGGGGIKFLPQGSPLPEKYPLGQKWGEGGGGYITFPWTSAPWAHELERLGVIRIAARSRPCFGTFKTDSSLPTGEVLVARAIRNAIRANRFARIIRN